MPICRTPGNQPRSGSPPQSPAHPYDAYMVDFLIGLMPLAAQDDHIARLRVVHGPVNGLDPIHHHGKGVALPSNPGRISAIPPAPLSGDCRWSRLQNQTSPPPLCPSGALFCSVRSPPQPNTATVRLCKLLHRLQHIHHAVRRVGVVDEDRIVFARRGNDLHRPFTWGTFSRTAALSSREIPSASAAPSTSSVL